MFGAQAENDDWARNTTLWSGIVIGLVFGCLLTWFAALDFSAKSQSHFTREPLGRLVAVAALQANIDPMSLWREMEITVGKPYERFDVADRARAFEFISMNIGLPPSPLKLSNNY